MHMIFFGGERDRLLMTSSDHMYYCGEQLCRALLMCPLRDATYDSHQGRHAASVDKIGTPFVSCPITYTTNTPPAFCELNR